MLRQVVVSFVSSATLLAAGMNLGFSAVALPHMEHVEGPDRLTVDEGSWFASISFITTLLGCLTCGPLLDRMGRRTTLLVINLPFVAGWLLMWLAPRPAPVALLYVARLLTGLGGGMISIPANIYIAEMSASSMRCMLVTWPSLAISIGILLVYALGFVVHEWRHIAAISTFVPIATAAAIFLYVRESPVWLLSCGRLEDAEMSFKWIRQIDDSDEMPKHLVDEFETVVEKSKTKSRHPDDEPGVDMPLYRNAQPSYGVRETPAERSNGTFYSLLSPDVWKPLAILNAYFFFMQFSGIPVLIAYAVNIMMSEGVSLDSYSATLLLGIVKLLSEIGAGFLQNRFGRRPLSIVSGLGMAACMLGLGLRHQMFAQVGEKEQLSWLPLLLILAYVVSAAIGFFLIPWAMLGEVYPTRVAGLACGITTCLGNMFGFASIKLFPTLVVLLGGVADGGVIHATEGVFYMYAAITAVAVLFICIFLPETFRRTPQQVSDGFTRTFSSV